MAAALPIRLNGVIFSGSPTNLAAPCAPLSIEQTPARGDSTKLTVERTRAKGFDPYARVGNAHVPEPKKQPAKRDLKKLGEWIKLKRELEARKAAGEDVDVE